MNDYIVELESITENDNRVVNACNFYKHINAQTARQARWIARRKFDAEYQSISGRTIIKVINVYMKVGEV